LHPRRAATTDANLIAAPGWLRDDTRADAVATHPLLQRVDEEAGSGRRARRGEQTGPYGAYATSAQRTNAAPQQLHAGDDRPVVLDEQTGDIGAFGVLHPAPGRRLHDVAAGSRDQKRVPGGIVAGVVDTRHQWRGDDA